MIINNIAGILSGKIDNLPNATAATVLDNVLSIFYYVAGIAAVLTIIIAGYYYTTSSGNPAAVSKAKSIIFNSVIGLIIIVVAFAITKFVIGSMG